MKKYHIWTKSGNLDLMYTEDELESQKMCSYGFYYQLVGDDKVTYWGKGSPEFEEYVKKNDKIVL